MTFDAGTGGDRCLPMKGWVTMIALAAAAPVQAQTAVPTSEKIAAERDHDLAVAVVANGPADFAEADVARIAEAFLR